MNPDGSLDPVVMGILGLFLLPLIIKICSWVYDCFDTMRSMSDTKRRNIYDAEIKAECDRDTQIFIANEKRLKAAGLPTVAEQQREERLTQEDDVARSRGEPTRKDRENFAAAMEKIATRGALGKTISVSCECCGAPIGDVDNPCEYCGVITVFV